MYYQQSSYKSRTIAESYYTDRDKLVRLNTTFATSEKRVYSFRSSRPKNDSATAVVPGESLMRNRAEGIKGIASYLNSYKAALQSLNDEAGQVSTNSGYGAMDKGHYFSSCPLRVATAVLHGQTIVHYDSSVRPRLLRPFVSGVFIKPSPGFYRPGDESTLPTEVANAIQELALSTMPDKITGSLGQDIVDIAELPNLLRHITSIGRDMTHMRSTWAKLSVKARHAIDVCIRDRSRAPKWALRAAGSGYLEWLFVLSPYIQDMKVIMRTLSGVSSASLNRYSFTRNKLALVKSNAGTCPTGGGCRNLVYDGTSRESYSVHLAIAWVRRGPSPSDESFASKAIRMNQALGVWYPSLLWDLTPWTWLVDWCTHIGDTIDNTYAISNSAFRPAYAWATVRDTVTCDGSFAPFMRADSVEPNRFHVSNSSLFRYPVQVTGVVQPSFSGLSGGQRSILAALGLSHIKL